MSEALRVLITTDFSDHARAGVERGLEFAARLGVTPTVLYVVKDPKHSFDLVPAASWSTTMFDAEMVEKIIMSMQVAAEDEMKIISDLASEKGIEIEPRVDVGHPVDVIVELSKKYDMIIMSSAGRGKMAYGLFGHVSARVLRQADCPVLLVKSEA